MVTKMIMILIVIIIAIVAILQIIKHGITTPGRAGEAGAVRSKTSALKHNKNTPSS